MFPRADGSQTPKSSLSPPDRRAKTEFKNKYRRSADNGTVTQSKQAVYYYAFVSLSVIPSFSVSFHVFRSPSSSLSSHYSGCWNRLLYTPWRRRRTTTESNFSTHPTPFTTNCFLYLFATRTITRKGKSFFFFPRRITFLDW